MYVIFIVIFVLLHYISCNTINYDIMPQEKWLNKWGVSSRARKTICEFISNELIAYILQFGGRPIQIEKYPVLPSHIINEQVSSKPQHTTLYTFCALIFFIHLLFVVSFIFVCIIPTKIYIANAIAVLSHTSIFCPQNDFFKEAVLVRASVEHSSITEIVYTSISEKAIGGKEVDQRVTLADKENSDVPLPEGWERRLDEKGRMYYINKELHLSTWRLPEY